MFTLCKFNYLVCLQERLLDKKCGTTPYMAPEILLRPQYRAEPVDIWSCGIILVAMLAGGTLNSTYWNSYQVIVNLRLKCFYPSMFLSMLGKIQYFGFIWKKSSGLVKTQGVLFLSGLSQCRKLLKMHFV